MEHESRRGRREGAGSAEALSIDQVGDGELSQIAPGLYLYSIFRPNLKSSYSFNLGEKSCFLLSATLRDVPGDGPLGSGRTGQKPEPAGGLQSSGAAAEKERPADATGVPATGERGRKVYEGRYQWEDI